MGIYWNPFKSWKDSKKWIFHSFYYRRYTVPTLLIYHYRQYFTDCVPKGVLFTSYLSLLLIIIKVLFHGFVLDLTDLSGTMTVVEVR